jgi:hypothetical protein
VKNKKNYVLLCQNVPFGPRLLQASAAPRIENPDSKKKDALFGVDTQITIPFLILDIENLILRARFVGAEVFQQL